MTESTTPAQCSEADWKLARKCGLFTATPGTNAWDAALGRFADSVRSSAPQPQGGALTFLGPDEDGIPIQRFSHRSTGMAEHPNGTYVRYGELELRARALAQSAPSAPQQAGDGLTLSDYEAAFADHQRVVRELDVLLNGDAAAKQASLCDIVSQVRKEGIRSRGVALTEKQTTDLHSHMMNVAMTAWREEADAVVGSSVRSRLRAVVKALAAAPKIRADLSAAPRQPEKVLLPMPEIIDQDRHIVELRFEDEAEADQFVAGLEMPAPAGAAFPANVEFAAAPRQPGEMGARDVVAENAIRQCTLQNKGPITWALARVMREFAQFDGVGDNAHDALVDSVSKVMAEYEKHAKAAASAQQDEREAQWCGRCGKVRVSCVACADMSDDKAVDIFAAELKAKLAKAREKGRGGWQECEPGELSQMLREHVEKGDPRDVANFCMFLWHLDAPISRAAQQVQADAGAASVAPQIDLQGLVVEPDDDDSNGVCVAFPDDEDDARLDDLMDKLPLPGMPIYRTADFDGWGIVMKFETEGDARTAIDELLARRDGGNGGDRG